MESKTIIRGVILGLVGLVALQAQQQKATKELTEQKASQTEKKPKPDKAPRKRVVPDLSGFELAKPGKAVAVGGTRYFGSPPLLEALAPKLGKMYGAEPLFAWSYKGAAGDFTLIIRQDGYGEIFRTPVNGTQFAYPTGAPPASPQARRTPGRWNLLEVSLPLPHVSSLCRPKSRQKSRKP
jgi:hypothetical protein